MRQVSAGDALTLTEMSMVHERNQIFFFVLPLVGDLEYYIFDSFIRIISSVDDGPEHEVAVKAKVWLAVKGIESYSGLVLFGQATVALQLLYP